MEYLVKTTKENRLVVIDKISLLGRVVEKWPDGSFNFAIDGGCEDEFDEICEDLAVEADLS